MSIIVPAILEKTPEAFVHARDILTPFSGRLHVDIADGSFVPNRTLTLDELKDVQPQPIAYDVHLMVERPERMLQILKTLSATCIVAHAESSHNLRAVLMDLRRAGKKVGVALNPDTPASVIEPIMQDIDMVVFLAVEPGFQGGVMVQSVHSKIQEFRKVFPDMPIAVDGAINEATIQNLLHLHIQHFIVGSAIIHSEDPSEAYRTLNNLVTHL